MMQKISFYLLLPLLFLISILPFRLLYLFSDFIFIFIYHVFGYRKFVVRKNLKNSFPEKTQSELKQIEVGFYHYIVDFFLEMLKCYTISAKEIKKRISVVNPEILEKYYLKNKNIVVCLGHFGNYEWANLILPFTVKHQTKFIYKPFSNQSFDEFVYKNRTKFGSNLISMKEAYREMKKKSEKPFALYLINDQSAPPENSYFTTFLNQETSFFTGTEKIPRMYDLPVFYMCIRRVKRGFYQIKYELLIEKPNELAEGEINELHARKLEKDIKQAPETWFWSHKRWKWKKVGGEYLDLNYQK